MPWLLDVPLDELRRGYRRFLCDRDCAIRVHRTVAVVHTMLVAPREYRALCRCVVVEVSMALGAIAAILLGIILVSLIRKAGIADKNAEDEYRTGKQCTKRICDQQLGLQ